MASCHSYARQLQALQARTTSRQATYVAEAALNPLVDDYEHLSMLAQAVRREARAAKPRLPSKGQSRQPCGQPSPRSQIFARHDVTKIENYRFFSISYPIQISPLRPFSPFKIYLLAIVALDALSPTLRPSFLTTPPLSSITYFTGPAELMIAFE